MSYELEFMPKALKEWQKLDSNTKEQFKKISQATLKSNFTPKPLPLALVGV